jgi:uncharacterized Zn finger protein
MDLSDEQLRELAGESSFERGQKYARQGRVAVESRTEGAIKATVRGTESYSVRLAKQGSDYDWSCNCPAAEARSFCKHLVAVAIAARDGAESASVAKPADEPNDSDLRGFLRSQSAERLADLLMELADSDSAIEKRLLLIKAESDPSALKKALASVLKTGSFLDYRASNQFARRLDPAIASLKSAAAADPAHALELYEYALTRLLKLYERSDDSGGVIGDRIREVASDYRACMERTLSDSTERGKNFQKLERLDQWRFFDLRAFWSLLGEKGQHAFASAVESDFAALSERTESRAPGEKWGEEFSITDRMERLAEVRGEVDVLIRVIARDLSSGYAYARIVEICRKAGRRREAMQWAERGYKHHPSWRGLRPLLAEEYQHAGLQDDALAVLWEDFCTETQPDSWKRLKEAAADRWPTYRDKALAHVEKKERQVTDGRHDVSTRVMLLLSDGDSSAARELAEGHAVGISALEHLARAVAREHPRSAAGFLKRVVEATLPSLPARNYQYAANQIRDVIALDPGSEADAWLANLKTRYRARRKLMELLGVTPSR